ncbi:MAG: type VI secretion system tip protein VgrG [Acidobacteriaceae bacterium]|nr:type VI secretion system tip protein VgrG [Acidobacteriaceae bacterium]
MADITQDNRLLAMTTPAGKDVLLLERLSGEEGVSRPFRFVLDLVADVQSDNPAKIKPHNLVGKPFTIRIALEEGKSKYINGICESFSKGAVDDEFAHYSAAVVPWFSLLNLSSNCSIFSDKAVPDIIQEVVSKSGFSSQFQSKLTKSYTTWDYCVQYRETDFSFLSRIMEAEGIYYYFAHEDGNHTMIVGDAPSCYESLPNQSTFAYSPVTGVQNLEDTIREWSVEERIHTGKWTTRDYHHEMPSNDLQVSEVSNVVCEAGKSYEVYDYPGDHAKKFNKPESRIGDVKPEGEKLATLRIEEQEANRVLVSGRSLCRAFTSGYKIMVTGGDAAGSYFLTGTSHQALQYPDYRNRDVIQPAYENSFTCIDASVPFKQRERTPKPVVLGLQTALVIDESSAGNSEEIWPDKYGRVRVRFPWDRDANYACWLRVIQPWGGKSWGQQWLPRTGDEVAVAFLEGDPDCPVVVGSVYNSQNLPIFTLPDNKTQSGIQTHSSPGGGTSNYNMFRFEDKIGNEEIYIQAEKDWNSLIKNDETRTVKNNRTTKIHVNDSRTVETGDDSIDVQQGKRTISIMGNLTETVKQGNISQTADQGNISTTASMGNISTTANMGNISTQADMGNISTQADLGNITIQASVGSITISGLSGVTISCGASTIEMTPASISISAPIVMINS